MSDFVLLNTEYSAALVLYHRSYGFPFPSSLIFLLFHLPFPLSASSRTGDCGANYGSLNFENPIFFFLWIWELHLSLSRESLEVPSTRWFYIRCASYLRIRRIKNPSTKQASTSKNDDQCLFSHERSRRRCCPQTSQYQFHLAVDGKISISYVNVIGLEWRGEAWKISTNGTWKLGGGIWSVW